MTFTYWKVLQLAKTCETLKKLHVKITILAEMCENVFVHKPIQLLHFPILTQLTKGNSSGKRDLVNKAFLWVHKKRIPAHLLWRRSLIGRAEKWQYQFLKKRIVLIFLSVLFLCEQQILKKTFCYSESHNCSNASSFIFYL